MSVLALIPARSGSRGVSRKNWRELGGFTLVEHAVRAAHRANIDTVVISADEFTHLTPRLDVGWRGGVRKVDAICLPRPLSLAQDDTPMLAVVQHALAQIPGPDDQIVVLLQPTQPLRRPEHVQQAITLLRESGADSVVGVVEVPHTHNLAFQLRDVGGALQPWIHRTFAGIPARRQDVIPAYIRDGTVYAFWRKTVDQHGTIYGQDVRPLIIDPADTCELDTEADWAALERRWKERHD